MSISFHISNLVSFSFIFLALADTSDTARIRRAKVAFSYTAENDDELSLNLGEIIEIVGDEEEGWWRGKLNGKEGVFPCNFVEPIEEEEEPPPYSNLPTGKPSKEHYSQLY